MEITLSINALYAAQCVREQTARIQKVIPHDYQGGFDALEDNTTEMIEMKHRAVVWATRFKPYETIGINLRGRSGTGKTHLAYCILQACLERGLYCKARNIAGFLCELKSTWSKANDSEDEMRERLLNSDVLLLDDFGTSGKDWDVEQLYLLFDAACCRKRPAIITTTNYNDESLVHIFGVGTGEAVLSRLHGACEHWTGFPKEDYRKRGQKDE